MIFKYKLVVSDLRLLFSFWMKYLVLEKGGRTHKIMGCNNDYQQGNTIMIINNTDK